MKTKIKINPRYKILCDFVYSVPYMFSLSGEIVYIRRNILKSFTYIGFDLNVKSFYIPNVLNRFAYSYIRKSKARRSYEHALFLSDEGISTPEPVAYIEIYDTHMLKESYYISMQVTADGTIRDVLGYGSRCVNRQLVSDFIEFSIDMHKKGVLHKDYSPSNILYTKDEEGSGYHFMLVDLNRMRMYAVGFLSKCRVWRRLSLNKSDIKLISWKYSKEFGFNECLWYVFISLFNHLFWKNYLFWHPEERI